MLAKKTNFSDATVQFKGLSWLTFGKSIPHECYYCAILLIIAFMCWPYTTMNSFGAGRLDIYDPWHEFQEYVASPTT